MNVNRTATNSRSNIPDTQGVRYTRRQKAAMLALILLVALMLRLWGVNFGLPYLYHPDEPVPIVISQNMLKTGDLNPHFFHWPSLLFYVDLLAYIPYYLLGKTLGAFQNPNDILTPVQLVMGVARTQMPTTILLGRLITIAFGVGAVFLAFLAGKQLSNGKKVGLLAALMMTLSPVSVQHSRFITPDTLAVFFVLASIYASLLVHHRGKTRHYVLAGICVGLAASSKYNMALAALPLLLAHLVRPGGKGLKERNLYVAMAASALAFLCTTPFALLDFPQFLDGLTYDSSHYSTGHAGMEGNTLLWYLDYLWSTTGPICLLALLGAAYGLLSRSREIAIVSVFPTLFFLFISRFTVRNERTILPLIPFLFLLAAWLLMQLVDRAGRLERRSIRNTVLVVLGALAALPMAWFAADTVRASLRLTTVDSRETARVWIQDNLPPGARVAIESYSAFVDPNRYSVQGFIRMIDHTPDWYIDQDFDYLVFGDGMFGRFYREPDKYAAEIAQYDLFFAQFEQVRVFTDAGYQVRIYGVADR